MNFLTKLKKQSQVAGGGSGWAKHAYGAWTQAKANRAFRKALKASDRKDSQER